jgi:predicted secreted Zn-dependent protease
LVLSAFLVFGWPHVAAGFEENVSTQYYEVGGDTPARIWEEMRMRGPTGRDGRRYNARTEWHVRWRYPLEETGTGCEIGRVSVTLTVRYTMPRWERPPGTSSAVASQWNRYVGALESHEEGHADFGREAAQRIERALGGLSARASCNQLDREANALGQRILDEIRPEEEDYDRETNHGATQGTAFFRDLAGR